MQVALTLFSLLLISGFLAGWIQVFRKLASGQPLVPWSDRRPVPWGLLVLAIALFLPLLNLIGSFLDSGSQGNLQTAQPARMVWLNIMVELGLIAATWIAAEFLNNTTPRDFGFSLSDLVADLQLGVIAFVLLVPPVYALQAILIYFWKPSHHPLIELFQANPTPGFFALFFVAAAIVAPLFEEFVFRVLLQGYLEKLVGRRASFIEYLLGTLRPGLTPPQPVAGAATGDTDRASPFEVVDKLDEARVESTMPPLRRRAAFVPIAISSLIFALLHYTHGPDWVPLTLLAIGLGYLYQRTHRLVPSLVVHVLLNSMSMAGLWIQTYVPGMDTK